MTNPDMSTPQKSIKQLYIDAICTPFLPLYYFVKEMGGIFIFYLKVNKTFLTTTGNWPAIVAQTASVTIRSLPTVVFAGIFVGAILVLQFSEILKQYDALTFLGGLNTSATIREVGPLIISFLIAGKVGAFTAAELGTMRVTEQIDAVECLGTNPLQYLIVPRFSGIVISSLFLQLIGLTVSVMGSIFVASVLCGINPLQYVTSISRFSTFWTLASGLFRALIYGSIVAGVACYKGYTASGGARGVGKAVTEAAVYTNLYIVVADFLITQVLDIGSVLFSSVGGSH